MIKSLLLIISLTLISTVASAQTSVEDVLRVCGKHNAAGPNVRSTMVLGKPMVAPDPGRYVPAAGWEDCNKVISRWASSHFHALTGDPDIDQVVSHCDTEALHRLLNVKQSWAEISQKDCGAGLAKWNDLQAHPRTTKYSKQPPIPSPQNREDMAILKDFMTSQPSSVVKH